MKDKSSTIEEKANLSGREKLIVRHTGS
jgi:hypothetical protein